MRRYTPGEHWEHCRNRGGCRAELERAAWSNMGPMLIENTRRYGMFFTRTGSVSMLGH